MTAFGWRRAAWTFLGTLLIVNFVIVAGIRTGRSDAIDYFCPYYTLVADAARQGQLLLWTPLVDGGAPVGFEPQVGAASPLQLIFGLATGGNEFGFRLYWLTIWGLGGCGVLLLARHLAAPAWAACVAAIGFAFSAIYISHASHTSYLVTMSLFPWVLWRLDAAILQRSWFAAVQAGALWGLSALGGYPGLVLAGGGYAVAWCFGRLFLCERVPNVFRTRRVREQNVVRTRRVRDPAHGVCRLQFGFLIAVLAIFSITGLAVLSPTYAGFWAESRGYTSRSAAVSRETALGGGLPPAALATFASPYLSVWNSKSDHPLWHVDVTMSSIYLSPLLLVLALNLQGAGRNARFRRFLLIVALLYLLVSLGGATPLYGWFYDLVPPVRFLRTAAAFRCHYLVTVVVLALLAAAAYRETPPGPAADAFWKGGWRASLVLAGLAAVAFVVLAWAAAGGQHDLPGLMLAVVHFVVVWAATVWLFRRGCQADESVRQRIVCRHFVSLAMLDAALTMAVGHATVCGKPTLWRAAAADHVVSVDLTRRGLDRQLSTEALKLPPNGNFLSKTPVLASYAGMVNEFHGQYVGHPILSAGALGPQRIWFAPGAIETPPSEDAFRLFLSAAEQRGRPCLVVAGRKDCLGSPGPATDESRAKVAEDLSHAPPAEPIAVALREYSPNRLIFDVEAPRDGWLLVTDRWASGWQATVNGRDAPVWLGNFIFRALRVGRGANRVAFAYRPFGHPWLLLLSWTTLGAVGAATVVGGKKGTSNMRKDGDVVQIAGDYQYRALTEGIAVQRFWHHAKLLAVQRYLPPAETDCCLDVGCGSGIVTSYLGERARRVVGIDCNPAAVDFAARQFAAENVSFRLGLVDKDMNFDEPIDKIYCLEVIEHVYLTQAAEMLQTFHRALRPGGAVFLTTPNYRSFWPLIEWSMDRLGLAPRLAGDQHVEPYHARKLAALGRANGFSVESIGAVCFLAPWLAAIHWRLAERCFAWECRWPRNPGSILVAVLRKPIE